MSYQNYKKPSNTLAPVEKKQSFSLFVQSSPVQASIANAISSPLKRARFVTSLVTLVTNTPTLRDCDSATIVTAALNAEAFGLPLNNQLGFNYVIPFNDPKNGRIVAQYQIGYKGLIQLAMRSGKMKKLHVCEVKQGELVKFNPILNDFEFSYLVNPDERAKAPTVGYYAYFETINGFVQEMYWTKEQMEFHAETYSKGYAADKKKGTEYTFWSKNFDAMAKKTMLKQLLGKYAPLDVDTADVYEAIQKDQTVTDANGNTEYTDNDVIEGDNPTADSNGEIKSDETANQAPDDKKPVEAEKVSPETFLGPKSGESNEPKKSLLDQIGK